MLDADRLRGVHLFFRRSGPGGERQRTRPYATTIGFTFGGSLSDLAEAVALAESGRVRPHIQHFRFDQIEDAYGALHDGKVSGRAVILPA